MSPSHGAWYADPYGSPLQQRWWDGTKWTREVRPTPADAPAPTVRIAAPTRLPADPPVVPKDRATRGDGPRVPLRALLGHKLTVSQRSGKSSGRYALMAPDGRPVASVDLYQDGALAMMRCPEGAWRLYQRTRIGWDLAFESVDGEHAGWYSGRRWSTARLILADGQDFDVRARLGHWTVCPADGKEPILEIHGHVLSRTTVTVHHLPKGAAHGPAAILTTCAVAFLVGAQPNAGLTVMGPPGC